jgi:adenylate cyclase
MKPVERRLAAILAADVAGYSRLMGLDEAGTAQALRDHRAAADPLVAQHGGRIVKTTGDGVLIEFGSVVGAVQCAIALQRLTTERNADSPGHRRMEWRIGIHIGDVLVEGDDILGDGVNIAARLEGIAEPGGICISDDAFRQVRGKIEAEFADIGEQSLKNIARPLRVYSIGPSPGTEQPTTSPTALPLPDKPSVAVLPFTNMSADLEQEFFADGIAEDVITALSRYPSLFVIARNSSFTYKGRAVDVKQVGRELGVRYVLEGSVRKAGNRVRVTGQLIEAATGGHLWAERYDRDLTDIFAVQDEITASVSAAIFPTMERSERERAARKPTESLDAWECYYRGMWHFAKFEAVEIERARSLFQRAINLDPQFAPAVATLALTYLNEITLFRPDLRGANLPLALDHSMRAVNIDATDATGHSALARSLWMSGRHDESLAQAEIAVRCDPNSAAAHGALGGARLWGGFPRQAIEPLQTAMRLSPFDPLTPLWLHFIARAHYWSGNYKEAIAVARQLRQSNPNFRQPYNTLIASLGQVGDVDEVHAVMTDALVRFGESFRIFLSLPLDELRELRSEDREHLMEGYRKAGLLVE